MTIKEAREQYYDHFFGKPVSIYGLTHGYIDYACLASVGNIVYCSAMENRYQYFDLVNGSEIDAETNDAIEFAAYYIIDETLAKTIMRYTQSETIWVDNDLNVYVWGIKHCNTAWNYVLTDIPLIKKY